MSTFPRFASLYGELEQTIHRITGWESVSSSAIKDFDKVRGIYNVPVVSELMGWKRGMLHSCFEAAQELIQSTITRKVRLRKRKKSMPTRITLYHSNIPSILKSGVFKYISTNKNSGRQTNFPASHPPNN